jgi:FAD/FMN-containing dehydrogenase
LSKITRRALLAGAGAIAGATAVGLAGEQPAALPEYPPVPQGAGELLNDAGELSPVRVEKHVLVNVDRFDAAAEAVRQELAEARREGRPAIASAARHSMGGQSLSQGGTVLTMDQRAMELDQSASTYRVAAGARWSSVIAALDAQGFSPAVMQSNNDFAVASTFCVNAHGWPVPYGPFGSTVRSFRMILADGSLVTCSRSENADIFRLTMGGYGLTGIILDLEVDMVPNVRLEPSYQRLSPSEFGTAFAAAAEDGEVLMAYGRLDVATSRFLDETLMITYRAVASDDPLPAATGSGFVSHAARQVYRAQPGSDRVKRLRWWMETSVSPRLAGHSTRNSLMNEPAATLSDGDPTRTDILHEYFVPAEALGPFTDACRDVVPRSFQELLNVTLRYVRDDPDSVLAYASGPRIAAVMSFTQEKSERAEADMARMTGALIDRVLDLGGSYYLPYRLHAELPQMQRAYPRLDEFVERKRALDPDERFRNALWDRIRRTV